MNIYDRITIIYYRMKQKIILKRFVWVMVKHLNLRWKYVRNFCRYNSVNQEIEDYLEQQKKE